MKYLIDNANGVADAFFDMTAAIRSHSVLETKTNELIIIGVLTANRSLRGIDTHVRRALEAGATQEEVISAIVLALPVVGIANVNLALDAAMTTLRDVEK